MSWQKVAQPFCPTKPWVRTEALRKAGLRLAAEDLAQQVGAAQVAILDDRALGVTFSASAGTDVQPISAARSRGVVEQALGAARALGCRSAVLVDLVVSESGNEYVVGVDPMPRLDGDAAFVDIARKAGMEHDRLCELVLQGATLGARASTGERRRISRAFWGAERRSAAVLTH